MLSYQKKKKNTDQLYMLLLYHKQKFIVTGVYQSKMKLKFTYKLSIPFTPTMEQIFHCQGLGKGNKKEQFRRNLLHYPQRQTFSSSNKLDDNFPGHTKLHFVVTRYQRA